MGLFKRRSEELFTIPGPGPSVPGSEPAAGSGFRMAVVDVFVITGRGMVVTGTVQAGAVTVGARVTIERAGRPPLAAEIAAMEKARKTVRQATAGDSVGLLFRSLAHADVVAGDVVVG
jgi:translation elongation factor EF-Tu-like GTPase